MCPVCSLICMWNAYCLHNMCLSHTLTAIGNISFISDRGRAFQPRRHRLPADPYAIPKKIPVITGDCKSSSSQIREDTVGIGNTMPTERMMASLITASHPRTSLITHGRSLPRKLPADIRKTQDRAMRLGKFYYQSGPHWYEILLSMWAEATSRWRIKNKK